MKTKKILPILSVVLLLSIVFAGISYCTTGTITGKTVRIRKSPSTEAEIITNVYKKDNVTVLEKEGDWYKVEYEGNEGYIHKDYIDVEEEITSNTNSEVTNNEEENKSNEVEQPASSTSVKEIRVNDICTLNKDTKLYILPLFSCPVLENITAGSSVTVIQVVNNWVYVQGNNKVGWIVKSSIDRILNPVPITFEIIPFILLFISILVKVWLSRFNKFMGRVIKW